jgi:hypothetical protein
MDDDDDEEKYETWEAVTARHTTTLVIGCLLGCVVMILALVL